MDNINKVEFFLIAMDYATLQKNDQELAIKYTKDHLRYFISKQERSESK